MPTWRPEFEPRRWQREALAAWEGADRRGIVSVVTGAGKTAFAELAMARFLEEEPDGQIVILVPTVSLLDQWFVSLQDDMRVTEPDISTYSGEGRSKTWSTFNLVVLNTGRSLVARRPEKPTMLIVDECHRAASPANRRALHGRFTATLGMSATPERDYDDGLDEVLVPSLGPVVYRYDYSSASQDGVVSPFHLVNVKVALRPEEQLEYERFTRRIARYLSNAKKDGTEEFMENSPTLRRLLQARASVAGAASMRIPAAVRIVDQHKEARCVVFHERIDAATAIQKLLSERGHRAILYHSGIPAVVRRDNLRMYRRGVFSVLVTCRALDEGINVPDTSVGVIASSTASVRQRVQRLGRLLRPAPGKDSAMVYTIHASPPEERRLAEEAQRDIGASSVEWREVRMRNDA